MTNLWRLFDVWGGRFELTQKLLHEKYGPVVRLDQVWSVSTTRT